MFSNVKKALSNLVGSSTSANQGQGSSPSRTSPTKKKGEPSFTGIVPEDHLQQGSSGSSRGSSTTVSGVVRRPSSPVESATKKQRTANDKEEILAFFTRSANSELSRYKSGEEGKPGRLEPFGDKGNYSFSYKTLLPLSPEEVSKLSPEEKEAAVVRTFENQHVAMGSHSLTFYQPGPHLASVASNYTAFRKAVDFNFLTAVDNFKPGYFDADFIGFMKSKFNFDFDVQARKSVTSPEVAYQAFKLLMCMKELYTTYQKDPETVLFSDRKDKTKTTTFPEAFQSLINDYQSFGPTTHPRKAQSKAGDQTGKPYLSKIFDDKTAITALGGILDISVEKDPQRIKLFNEYGGLIFIEGTDDRDKRWGCGETEPTGQNFHGCLLTIKAMVHKLSETDKFPELKNLPAAEKSILSSELALDFSNKMTTYFKETGDNWLTDSGALKARDVCAGLLADAMLRLRLENLPKLS